MSDDKHQLNLRLGARDDARIAPQIEAQLIRALAELLLAAATDGPAAERGAGIDDE